MTNIEAKKRTAKKAKEDEQKKNLNDLAEKKKKRGGGLKKEAAGYLTSKEKARDSSDESPPQISEDGQGSITARDFSKELKTAEGQGQDATSTDESPSTQTSEEEMTRRPQKLNARRVPHIRSNA